MFFSVQLMQGLADRMPGGLVTLWSSLPRLSSEDLTDANKSGPPVSAGRSPERPRVPEVAPTLSQLRRKEPALRVRPPLKISTWKLDPAVSPSNVTLRYVTAIRSGRICRRICGRTRGLEIGDQHMHERSYQVAQGRGLLMSYGSTGYIFMTTQEGAGSMEAYGIQNLNRVHNSA